MTAPRRSPAVRTALIAVGAFVVLGMPKAAFGVAWPSVAGDLGRSIGDLGAVLSVFVAGYLVGSLTVGRLVGRFGTGEVLAGAAAVATGAVAGYAVAGSWPVLLAAAIALGTSGGLLDAGLNAHVALHRGAKVMGWIHAGFGIGSAMGPLLITSLLAWDAGWRPGFWAIAVLQGLVAVALAVTMPAWDGGSGRPVRGRVARSPVVPAALGVFLLYVGLEVAAAQWAFTLLSEGRGVGEGTAGLAVTGFWVALTGSRVLLGIAGDRAPAARVAGVGAASAAGFVLLLWWSPAEWVGPAALVGLGAALGPIFPLQTLLTPQRVGDAATATMVGYQLAAASAGAILVPGGLGLLVGWYGLEVVPPVLAGTAFALVATGEAARRLGGAVTRQGPP